jgi:UDP-N-acetylmuramyl pentapeptide phosphotransferase/UDP-N-acetylglucosamine-1-phosphate transferase
VAESKHLFDEPGGRKLHKQRVPNLGGLAIFAGVIFTISFLGNFTSCPHMQHILAAIIVIIFVGLQDDIIGLPPFKKALGQIAAAAIIVVWGDLKITHMFGIFGIGALPEIVSVFFSIAVIVLIINAINLIDGINGLAASLSIIASFGFGTYFFQNEINSQHAIIAFALAGALIAFLRFNLTPARIFLGDTGSMLIGLLLSVLCFEFISLNKPLPLLAPKLQAAPVLAISFVFVPLYDLFRVFTIRLMKKKSPFYPDQNHLHHLLLKLGHSHLKAAVVLSLLAIVIIISAFILRHINIHILVIILLMICLGFTYFLNYRLKKKGEVSINGKE